MIWCGVNIFNVIGKVYVNFVQNSVYDIECFALRMNIEGMLSFISMIFVLIVNALWIILSIRNTSVISKTIKKDC